jgi:hypothetical protein
MTMTSASFGMPASTMRCPPGIRSSFSTFNGEPGLFVGRDDGDVNAGPFDTSAGQMIRYSIVATRICIGRMT